MRWREGRYKCVVANIEEYDRREAQALQQELRQAHGMH